MQVIKQEGKKTIEKLKREEIELRLAEVIQ